MINWPILWLSVRHASAWWIHVQSSHGNRDRSYWRAQQCGDGYSQGWYGYCYCWDPNLPTVKTNAEFLGGPTSHLVADSYTGPFSLWRRQKMNRENQWKRGKRQIVGSCVPWEKEGSTSPVSAPLGSTPRNVTLANIWGDTEGFQFFNYIPEQERALQQVQAILHQPCHFSHLLHQLLYCWRCHRGSGGGVVLQIQ